MPDKQKRLMVELINFFVAMTEESHLCHVIIASSNAFFIEQVYVDSKLRKTSQFMKLDYLEKEAVVTWLSDIKRHNKVMEYTLDDQQIEIIWDTVGGSAWEIYYILEKLFQYSLEKIVAKMKREKVAMIADWVDYDDIEDRRNLLVKFYKNHYLDRRQLTGLRNLLSQAVKDNILYYDPVEGAFGVQGKSLEWGIAEYFDTT